jgi:hypothetical protein
MWLVDVNQELSTCNVLDTAFISYFVIWLNLVVKIVYLYRVVQQIYVILPPFQNIRCFSPSLPHIYLDVF